MRPEKFNFEGGCGVAVTMKDLAVQLGGVNPGRLSFDMAAAGVKEVRMMAAEGDDGVTGVTGMNTGGGAGAGVLERTENTVVPKRPPMYKVIMLDDNTTPFAFVHHVLQKFFNVGLPQAKKLAWTVHTQGSAVVACYEKKRAIEKVDQVNSYCRAQGKEFTLTCEPDN